MVSVPSIPLGRRVAKECLSTQRITEYLWDGANIVQHSQKTADGSVVQTIEYLYEPESFRPLAQVTHKADQASQLHYIVTDYAGTPQELCSENGEVVWQGEQALWGHYQQQNTLPNHGFRENAQNDELYCDLRYQGQIEDRESGLYYNVNRYYDADSGQYLSPDPIGFSGGLRPQAYVFNPLDWVDPLGLAGCPTLRSPDDIAQKYGGKKIGPNRYQFSNKKTAKQAASEIAGDLGSDARKIPRSEYRDSKNTYQQEMSNRVIGKHSRQLDENNKPIAGYHDHSIGHSGFGDDRPHFNAWSQSTGTKENDNVHLYYPKNS